MDALILDGSHMTLTDLYEVMYDHRPVKIANEAEQRARAARQVLFDMAARGEPVYGLNRGVGWNKDKEFDQDFFEEYNRNLINSHSLGIQPYCSAEMVRAMLCIRLNTALCGCTGISPTILSLYAALLNHDIHPCVPARGSIGEGDISTLSLIGQTMLGCGEVEYHGKIVPASKALSAEGISPVVLGPKDGLSIVSSNAQGEAMAAVLIHETREILHIANAVFCLSLEGLNGGVAPLNEKVNQLRGLSGQKQCASECRDYLLGSYLYQPDTFRALQDPLSFRCASAIHGSVLDALVFVQQTLETQLNAPDDNPCILIEERTVSVSQNFETTTLALGIEMLCNALCHVSKAICHRLIHLVDPAFTGLSRFLTPEDIKVIAYSTIQKVYTALDTENRLLANPVSIDYIAVAGSIEDHASNLPLVCSKCIKLLDNLRYMIGIEAMHAAQAVDLRGLPALGKGTDKIYRALRKEIPFLDRDRNLSVDIEKAYHLVKSGTLMKKINNFFPIQ